ncbi:hypothetical protein GRO01_01590 [Gluconobacter roseus NBRC 3990]|uniref:PAC domain-containing protein n=2 Tax=Gluconobacter roseus TaxID=586239 RepID=A0A4Y3M1W5_9PROT|nr:hypothetical protein GRO01_01590 [Gluconobacter roseus NBRC 3990]GLP93043.1 hypothetical protein GCM10007871_10210 [Gluconobacter roseus NBRC 3990]
MYRTVASGHVWHGEICNRRRDGSLYWVDTTIVPHIAENGKVTSYVAIRFDITSRKQAENHLKASRQKLQKAVNTDFLTKISNRQHFSHAPAPAPAHKRCKPYLPGPARHRHIQDDQRHVRP